MGKPNFSTVEASSYLRDMGVEFTAGTLAYWRYLGVGPKFKRVAHKVYYEKEDLDKFLVGIKVDTVETIDDQIPNKHRLKLKKR